MAINEVTYYVAECDICGKRYATDEYDAYTAWATDSAAWEQAEDGGWFAPSRVVRENGDGTKVVEPRVVLCPECQRCEECGENGWPDSDGEHLVCGTHRLHDFAAVA